MSKTSPAESGEALRKSRKWRRRALFLLFILLISIGVNLVLWGRYDEYYAGSKPPNERYVEGDRSADQKIARIEISGTIMPPFTERTLKSLERAHDDPSVKGVLLVVDSPGGLVADSHEIYHQIAELRDKKPVVVSMRRLAASGGLYVAMGAGPTGKIFAEPTTWTGSIGVIIPRYEFTELAEKLGIESDSLKTGEFKDSLNPLRPLSDSDRELWNTILDESFQRFLGVIDANRARLEKPDVEKLATGQIYTATQALEAGLIDEIGFEDDAIAALKQQLKLKNARVVEYEHPTGLVDLLFPSMQVKDPLTQVRDVLNPSSPQAFYLYGDHSFNSAIVRHALPLHNEIIDANEGDSRQ